MLGCCSKQQLLARCTCSEAGHACEHEEANQFRRSKAQCTTVELTTSLHGVANGLTHAGHATLCQHLRLTGPSTSEDQQEDATCCIITLYVETVCHTGRTCLISCGTHTVLLKPLCKPWQGTDHHTAGHMTTADMSWIPKEHLSDRPPIYSHHHLYLDSILSAQ